MRELAFVSAALLRIPVLTGWMAVTAMLLLLLNPQNAQAQAGRDLTVDISQAGITPAIPTGTNVAFVITVSNVLAGQANNPVLVTVNVPSAFTSLSAQGTGFTCTFKGSFCSCTTPPPFAGNTQKTFRISGTAPSTISGNSQSFTLEAQVDPNNDVSETNNGNNSDNFTINVVTRADLDVDIATSPGVFTTQVAPDLVYVVIAKNTGNQDAPNILVRSTLPKDVDFIRVEENQLGTCLQNSTASDGALNVNCTLSSLPAGASRQVRIIGKVQGSVSDGVQVTFAANVDPNNTVPERNETNNTAFMLTTLRARSDVQLTGTAVASIPKKEGFGFGTTGTPVVVLNLTIKNDGPYQSKATTVTTAWPAGFTRKGTNCFDSCNVPALASGQTFNVIAEGEHKQNGTVQITSTADPNQTLFDPLVSNNSRTFSVQVP